MTHTSFSSSKGVISVLSALGAVATGLRGIPFGGESGWRVRTLEFELGGDGDNKHTQ